MKRLLKNLGNVATLASGAAGAQFIGVLAMPLLTRLYSPAEIGCFAIFFVCSQLLGTSMAGRYEQAIMLAANEAEEAALTALSLGLALSAALLCMPAAFLLGTPLYKVFSVDLGFGWVLLPVTALLVSVNLTLTMIAIRHARYTASSLGRLGKALAAVALQITAGTVFLGGVWGLIAGEALANLIAVAVLLLLLRDTDSLHIGQRLRRFRFRRGAMALAFRYRDLPLVNLPHSMFSSLAELAIFAFITTKFTSAEAGQYFMMQRVLMLPAGFIGLSVSQLFYRSAAQLYREHGRFDMLVWRVILGLGSLGLCLTIVLLAVGREAFVLVLGSQWLPAGELAQIYAPYVGVHLVLAALAPTSRVVNRLRQAFILALLQSAIFLVGFWLGMTLWGSLAGGVAGAAYLSLPFMVALISWYVWISRNPSFGARTVTHAKSPRRL